MFTSLPTLLPNDTYYHWSPPGSLNASQSSTAGGRSQYSTRDGPLRNPSGSGGSWTPLAAIRADENAILARKANIRRFGAGWLKPPGISRTLQGIWDEEAEREEQAAAALREQALADAQAAAEAQAQAEMRAAGMQAGAGEEELSGVEERDLDDDIPEADDPNWVDEEDIDGALPAEEGDGDYADDQVAMGGEPITADRDLDDDVPEAGSYQHTDTSLEEESSDAGNEADEEEDDDDAPIDAYRTRQMLPGNIADIPMAGRASGIRRGFGYGNSPPIPPGSRRSNGFGRGYMRGLEN